MATKQEVIKKFMASLDTTTLYRTAALDEAIQACSNFNSIQEVIDKMISDCTNAKSADDFLKNYCGINLDNEDTGAITGSDAGGKTVKDAESVVPEEGSLKNFTGNSFEVNGLTLKLVKRTTVLDRTLSHEFTHAAMVANISYYSYLPKFIREVWRKLRTALTMRDITL